MKFDAMDKKIVDLLVRDGRISYVELAEEVGLSRVAIKDRIQNMLDKNIIENFTASVNPAMLGLQISAFFELEVEPNKLHDVAHTLTEKEEVVNIFQMTGPGTLHMHVLVTDLHALEAFMADELYTLPGIIRIDSNIVLKRFKSEISYRL